MCLSVNLCVGMYTRMQVLEEAKKKGVRSLEAGVIGNYK